MCAGAIVAARIKRLVYGANDPKGGADGGAFDVLRSSRANHRVAVDAGVLQTEAAAQLQQFFRTKREAGEREASNRPRRNKAARRLGEVVEWLKAPASKAGERDERSESSNLSLSAMQRKARPMAGPVRLAARR